MSDQIIIEYVAKIDKLQSELRKSEQSQLALEKGAAKAGNAITAESNKAAGSINKINKEVNGLNTSFKNAGVAIAGVFAVSEIISFGKQIIDITAKFQRFEAVLTNTLGSKSEAQKALTMIKSFAASTPFAVDELTDSFVKLANQGFKPTQAEMRKLGDLAASQGKSFSQLTEGLLDATTFQFERLKEFGIRAEQSGNKIKFTFKGIQTTVDKTNIAVQKYILSLGDIGGVSGGMAAISKTLGGQISNLGDSFDALQVAIGNSLSGAFSGAISIVSDLVTGITNLISSNESATSSFNKQKEAVNNLEQNTVPLIDRYDELSKKSNLSKSEQDELDKIIVQIGKDIPTAITQFDDYGKAIGISANEAREFVKQQKAILAIKNKEAIQEQEEALKKLNSQLLNLQVVLSTGTKTINIGAGTFAATTKEVKLTGEEILGFQEKLSSLQFEKLGIEGLLDELKGVKKEVKETTQAIIEPVKTLTEFEKLLAAEREKIRKKELEDRIKDLLRWEQIQKEAGVSDLNIQSKTEIDKTDITKEDEDKRHKERVKEMKKFKTDVTDPLIKISKESEEAQTAKLIEEEAKRKALRQQALSQAIQISAKLLNSLNDLQLANTTANINNERSANEQKTNDLLASLDKRKELGIISETQLAAQKARILKDAARQESDLKKKQFEAEQKAAITRVNISTAEAVVKTLATYGFTPVAAIAAAGAIASGEIEKAIIRKQPVPKFKDGVIDFKGKGTQTSDSNTVQISNRESVIKAKQSIKHTDALRAIQDDYFEKYANINFVQPAIKKERERQRIKEEREKASYDYMKSLSLNGLLDTSHLERLTKKNKSVRLENVNEIVEGINKAVSHKQIRGL